MIDTFALASFAETDSNRLHLVRSRQNAVGQAPAGMLVVD